MADAAQIIRDIMAHPKIAASGNFAARVYRDEPILIPARQLEKMTPPRILEMRRLARGSFFQDAKVFHTQAKFMETYEDDFAYPGEFVQYYPTYQHMTDAQLRGYFSWRTNVRQGRIGQTSLSFAFVHVYELLNGVGARTPEEGFHALKTFWTAYREFDPRLDAYVPLWLKDYVVYHNLEQSLLRGMVDDAVGESVRVLLDDAPADADALFSALNAVSSYKLANSPFFKKHPDDVKTVVQRVFAAVSEQYNKRPGKSAGETFFGKMCASRYAMFKSAVFYHRGVHPDAVYAVDSRHKYFCRDGQWTCERFLRYGGNNKRIGALLKTIDFLMRRHYGMNSTFQPGKTNKAVTRKIEKEILTFLEEKRAATPAVIDIDVSKLQGIRAASLATRDRLLVEDPEEETITPAVAEDRVPNASAPSPGAPGLNADERHFLACLLHGRPCADVLRSRGLMASVLMDGINEKLFDRFGDTVIVDAGESPAVIEDYREELKGMVDAEGCCGILPI